MGVGGGLICCQARGCDMTFLVRGGARVPWGNATWPLASLECTPDYLRLRFLVVSSTIDRNNVEVITAHRGFASSGIRIFVKEEGRGGNPIFWYRQSDRLLEQLEELGWPVER
jgi:hypothetical protein